ncbi:MAG: processing protein [Solirubrobacteraceae bacterium]|jgi:DNA processing protein|nr:processing protein [Solirubrobacteraceae bacterium]
MTATACDACLRRTWLIARLAGAIEIARRQKRVLRELLALRDDKLIAALGDAAGGNVAAEFENADAAELRAAADAAGLAAVCRHDRRYPLFAPYLRDKPAVLFIAATAEDPLGRLLRLVGDRKGSGPPTVSIVGARRASPEGLEIARALARSVTAFGVTVVSGMALGIDSAAHAGALEAGAGTVAVLAGGADVPYPSSKRSLYRRILEQGCVVSEMPPGFTPFRWCFPARNRTIAALGHMTVVVEAAERSGSLITAEVAADLGRDVGAVPGPITSWRAKGTNALLHDGAMLVRNPDDVLDAVVGLDRLFDADPGAGLPPRLASLMRAVSGGRDTLAALAGTPDQAQSTLAALTDLELKGRLRRAAGGRYIVVPHW